MKPNLVLIQPAPVETDTEIDRFCEMMCETHYVYLIRPLEGFQEDSPAGVRFLKFSADRLPGFGEVETVILVGSEDLSPAIQQKYPTARLSHWPAVLENNIPALSDSSVSNTVIQGPFRRTASPELAKAM